MKQERVNASWLEHRRTKKGHQAVVLVCETQEGKCLLWLAVGHPKYGREAKRILNELRIPGGSLRVRKPRSIVRRDDQPLFAESIEIADMGVLHVREAEAMTWESQA